MEFPLDQMGIGNLLQKRFQGYHLGLVATISKNPTLEQIQDHFGLFSDFFAKKNDLLPTEKRAHCS